jgi:hypothetical protein
VARYRVLRWKDIPSLVEAIDGGETVQRPLSPRFQDLIDAVAIREDATESDAYLAFWEYGPEQERPGSAAEVAEQVATELEDGFTDLVVRRMVGPPV